MNHRHRFNWKNYILFSEYLHQNNTFEEEQTINRVISSRCYYGVFKPFEDYLKDKKIHPPMKDGYGNDLGSHDRVIYYVEKNLNRKIGRKLKRLKIYRVIADYKANEHISKRDRENIIMLSKQVFNYIEEKLKR